MRRTAAVLPAVLTAVLATAVVGLATPAQAAEAGGARAMAANHTGSDTDNVHGSCRTYASSAGNYGAVCSAGGTARNYRALLGGAPVPTCWLLPPDETGPTMDSATPFGLSTATPVLTPGPTDTPSPVDVPSSVPTTAPVTPPVVEPTPGTPPTTTGPPEPTVTETTPVEVPADFLKVCMTTPVDPVTLAPARVVGYSSGVLPFLRSSPDRPPFWWELTEGQRRYLISKERTGRLHPGMLVTSPSRTPRLGQTISFSAEGDRDVPLDYGLLRMRAEFRSLTVASGEPGQKDVECAGGGRELLPGATERTGPGICSFSYSQTSGGRGDGDTFDVRATENWRIWVSDDDGLSWTVERDVQIPLQLDLRVTEVQTLVVPLAP